MTLAQTITKTVDFFYVKPLRKIISQVTFRYVVCSGTNILLGWLIYGLLYKYVIRSNEIDLGVVVMSRHILVLFLQFPITFFTGFWLNRNVTFALSNLSSLTQLFRYLLQNAGSFVLLYLTLKLLVDGLTIYPTVARPIADAAVVIYSYLTARFFTFRMPEKSKK